VQWPWQISPTGESDMPSLTQLNRPLKELRDAAME
jgi:hypothetical protein